MPSIRNSALSRRRFLVSAGSAGLGAAAVALVGCGSGDGDDQAAPTPAAQPAARQQQQQQAAPAQQEAQEQAQQQQAAAEQDQAAAQQQQAQEEVARQQARAQAAPPRTLRIGVLGGSGGPLDPRNVDSLATYIAVDHVYDYLARVTTDGFQNGLAESMTSNDDATVWTIRLRDDARFHEGGPVTAEDVAATITRMADFATSPYFAAMWLDVDFPNMRALDARTLELPLLRPRSDYVESVLSLYTPIFPAGEPDFNKSLGSGAYRLEANDGASAYRLRRNEDWWGPQPQIEEIEILPLTDPAARINALKSGELDMAFQLTPAIAQAEAGNPDVAILRSNSGSSAMGFAMNTSLPPFDDPRVREAVRLSADRQQLVNSVLLGQGDIGNDLVGLGLDGYNDRLPQRSRDIDRARELFQQAGITQLDIAASEVLTGLVAATEIFAAQLAEAGVELRIDVIPPETFFADFARVLSTPFQVMYFQNRAALIHMSSFLGSGAVFNPTAFAPPEFDQALADAQAVVDGDERARQILAAQEIAWRDGGDLIWGFQPLIIAYDPALEGFDLSQDGAPLFHGARFTA